MVWREDPLKATGAVTTPTVQDVGCGDPAAREMPVDGYGVSGAFGNTPAVLCDFDASRGERVAGLSNGDLVLGGQAEERRVSRLCDSNDDEPTTGDGRHGRFQTCRGRGRN